jgi:hypothetical protein
VLLFLLRLYMHRTLRHRRHRDIQQNYSEKLPYLYTYILRSYILDTLYNKTHTQQTHPVGDAALFFQAKKKKRRVWYMF